MTPDYLLCDLCGAKTTATCRLFVETGYSFDGVENVTDGRNLDLCGPCAVLALDYLLTESGSRKAKDHCAGSRLLDWAKSKRRHC